MPPQGGRKHPHQEFLTIDTTNVLFICGGAFANLDKVIERRIGHKGVGFGAAIQSKEQRDTGELFEHCLPEDLIHYGLIPEFIGRLPVMCAVHQLSRDDLMQILTEPRNALVKQFQRFFQFDGIELVFADEALTLDRRQGARARDRRPRPALDHRGGPARRAVRAALPPRRQKCVVTKETIEKGISPTLVTVPARRKKRAVSGFRAAEASPGALASAGRGRIRLRSALSERHSRAAEPPRRPLAYALPDLPRRRPCLTAPSLEAQDPLRPRRGRAADLRSVAGQSGLFHPEPEGDPARELLDRDPAAQRHRRAAHGPRAERLDPGP